MTEQGHKQHIAIIGAGPAGLAAAWDIRRAGHAVTIFEGADRPGGLAAGFKDSGWAWELEKFYHHWFESDTDFLTLAEELGVRDQVLFIRPKTSLWSKGKPYLFDNPLSMLLFPNLPLIPKLRFGLVGLYLRKAKNWRAMEKRTAESWLIEKMGRRAYDDLWRPMLIGKFGEVYSQVTMAWFWARIHTRTTKLGTFQGGFQRFLDTFAATLVERGVTIRYNTPINRVEGTEKGITLTTGEGESLPFAAALSTASPHALLKIAPQIAERGAAYAQNLRDLKHMGAAVVILALKQSLLTDGTYWLNLPASSPDKAKSEFPFVALVEHTNFLPREHYNGDHLIYCGDYVMPDHPYLTMPEDALAETFTAALKHFNPAFTPDWVRARWVFRTGYAQPIPLLNHSAHIPDLATPLRGLYSANMSQVYPWDRGTNYAIQLGRAAAGRILEGLRP
ncbi:MAG TPA: NAD(P)/FAD-dependent oxidoreductase [Aggregatilineales bacterium]|nr:NAD(P)/FAD-dependent oxidoreductase [Anaerolineales bacterium]HRE49151.1 NAD(P)/FAD-dependent oxidoreductase [Aggregatilineales bacterium]